jgi:hypothetical protein
MFIRPVVQHVGSHEPAGVAPLRLSNSRPRDVALTKGGWLLLALAVLLFQGAIGAGVALYGTARRHAEDRRALLQESVVTSGVVTALWPRGDRYRRVEYEFAANGRVFRRVGRVSPERRAALQVGSPIEVRHVATDPAVNDLGGRPRTGIPMALPFIVAPVIGSLGVVCLVGIQRQRRLLSEGRVATATVTGDEKQSGSYGTSLSIVYEFELVSGAVASGRAGTSGRPPAIGSTVTVLYDPDTPTRSRLYPLSLVKPVH